MRHISFQLTTKQIRARTKFVTRRNGWQDLKVGELLQAIVQSQGLKRGEKQQKLCVIRVKSLRREPLAKMRERPYGDQEVILEGFPGETPEMFITMYCRANRCRDTINVNRIEFDYV